MIMMSLVISSQMLQISYYGSRAQLKVASAPRILGQHGQNRAYDILKDNANSKANRLRKSCLLLMQTIIACLVACLVL